MRTPTWRVASASVGTVYLHRYYSSPGCACWLGCWRHRQTLVRRYGTGHHVRNWNASSWIPCRSLRLSLLPLLYNLPFFTQLCRASLSVPPSASRRCLSVTSGLASSMQHSESVSVPIHFKKRQSCPNCRCWIRRWCAKIFSRLLAVLLPLPQRVENQVVVNVTIKSRRNTTTAVNAAPIC